MRSACIISIGNELLTGETVDTNTSWLCSELLSCGIPTVAVITVGDEVGPIVDAFRQAAERAEVVLATGGLGPTGDDLTRVALAAFLDVDLQFRQDLFEGINQLFTRMGREMPYINRVQAMLPAGARALPNSMGTAPGMAVEHAGRFIACMPGVPAEMKRMFHEQLKDHLRQLAGGQGVAASKLMCYGTGESAIATMLGDRMERGRNPLVNTTADVGVVTVHIVAAGENWPDAERLVEEERGELCKLLGDIVYGFDGQTLAEVAGSLLLARGRTLAVAESCTGGLLGKLITDVPGSSDYFRSGWVTYSNEAKVRDLDVDPEILQRDGAVSEAVACAMAEGARKRAGTEYALAITGIAGPGGGSEAKPAGLVYVALAAAQYCRCQQFIFHGDRQSVRRRSALAALDMLRLQLVN